ncbi:MAG: hypothetical protein E7316_07610 [Clostridiales bacterium]|nr:hypothetical protein [Clostridiales bacterium]
MYCRNCGTVVPGNEDLCEACRMEQIIQKDQSAPRPDMSGECRGAAICSAILSFVGLILSIVALALAMEELVGGFVFITMAGLACSVIALINGIRGISAFTRAGRLGATRPIASLICGIIGVSVTAFALLYWFIAIIGAIASF